MKKYRQSISIVTGHRNRMYYYVVFLSAFFAKYSNQVENIIDIENIKIYYNINIICCKL